MGQNTREMVVNYVPGEECRIAVLRDGKLEEFYSERRDQISHVGNIYVGRVTNVEPAIQAAFVDFGLEQSGFLHTSDLHPRYFPGEDGETTERVGKKTPRRERPPIQDCLRRGQEVIVQVLKEGVGSKGPTVTSYLSIPGRYLVMMPGMDRVGVSRKVEDEELRAKMKAILDQLELPEGFGFIVRTAGLDRSKTELKRDLAYLLRLQKDMERRRKAGGKPRLLYSESDLLVRALRDMMTGETDRVVIDSEVALQRAARFIKIVSPRSTTKLVHYTGKAPIFHAMGVQKQIETIYSREVPLPSGGRLVIDEAEALVAIDVNSGKHRDASDSETNALKTNLEAVDEIARQLRLRDLGGIVINDLIDMRAAKHRREVEQKFEAIMKEDRARSTLLPISEFGILEMTRQRMRGSHESQHFHECPTCHGRGLVQRADSVAADAMRNLQSLLAHDIVARAEMVIHPRVAGELLSTKRKALSRLERTLNKTVSVRLSDAIPVDRVTFYAYEANGNDIEIDRLPRHRADDRTLAPYTDPDPTSADLEEPEEQFDFAEPEEAVEEPSHPIEQTPSGGEEPGGDNFTIPAGGGRRRKRRRGRGGRDGEAGAPQGQQAGQGQQQQGRGPRQAGATPAEGGGDQPPADGSAHPTLVRADGGADQGSANNGQAPLLGPDGQPIPGEGGGRRRRRRRRRGRGRGGEGQPGGQPAGEGGDGQRSSESQPGDGSADQQGASAPADGGEAFDGDAADDESQGPDGGTDRPHGDGSTQQTGSGQQPDDGQGGGRRRRRRRRRGRGGGGGGGGPGGEQGGPRAQSGGGGGGGGQRPPQQPSGRESGGGGQGGQGNQGGQGGQGGGGSQPQAQRPRTLYAFNRRLKPGERPSARRDE
ncbi:MAG: Rne/Rng family ribonuclease [Phycisphaerae bacterium]|nr:Rne/Rng family ribonuclease [Phycisphaerae bacterium]